MKTQTRMILASVVVIALALTAVSGITYSWFSDEEKVQVDITTGTLEVKITSGSLTYNKINSDGTIEVDADPAFTATAVSSGDSVAITVNNFAPGNQFIVPLKIQNTGSLKAQVKVSFESNAGSEIIYKLSNLADSHDIGTYYTYDTQAYILGTASEYGTLTISMPMSSTTYGQSYNIVLKADAIQVNASVTDIVENTTLDKSSVAAIEPASTDASYIGIQLTSEEPSESITDVTMKAVSTTEAGSYSISAGETTTTILGGIQVTSANAASQSALSTAKATITYVFDGDLSGVTLYATHASSSGTSTTTAIDASKVTYDAVTGKTKIEIDADGFSTWFVSADVNSIVNGKYEKLTTDSFNNLINEKDTNIKLLNDVDVGLLELKSGLKTVINMNGKTISTTERIRVSHGTMELNGEGTVIGKTASNDLFRVVGSANTDDSYYSVLNIGKDIILKNDANNYGIIIGYLASTKGSSGAVVNFHGTLDCKYGFYSNGTMKLKEGKIPQFNIDGAKVIRGASYFAGYTETKITNCTFNSIINVKGGTFEFSDSTMNIKVNEDKLANVPSQVYYVTYGNGMINTNAAAIFFEQNSSYAGVSSIKFSGSNVFNMLSSTGEVVTENVYYVSYMDQAGASMVPDFGSIETSKIIQKSLVQPTTVAKLVVKFDSSDSTGNSATMYFTTLDAANDVKNDIENIFKNYFVSTATNITAGEVESIPASTS